MISVFLTQPSPACSHPAQTGLREGVCGRRVCPPLAWLPGACALPAGGLHMHPHPSHPQRVPASVPGSLRGLAWGLGFGASAGVQVIPVTGAVGSWCVGSDWRLCSRSETESTGMSPIMSAVLCVLGHNVKRVQNNGKALPRMCV